MTIKNEKTHLKESDKTQFVEDRRENEDIFRDTWIRYMGYANEVGEAFRGIISKRAVGLSYIVASGYVVADASSKAINTYEENKSVQEATIAGADCFLWQALASVAIPGFTINRLCAGSKFVLHKSRLSSGKVKWITTALGLAAIPFIIKPIDVSVDFILDKTARKLYFKEKE
ncbi:unnamed protein product [Dimorphilus gyrociliatus]|uniref:Mitochondrial fission process protein 1 n=1 Tax=Dimorphilus gyrociliatus TaxID=2664684 RepID=A0A7I8V925_9ANNE|nr:unnamed protein product [Dimorphilus gyrociliatus]